MSDTNLRLQVILNAVDKLTRPFRSAQAKRRLVSLIAGPASLNRFMPPLQHFGQRHNVSDGRRPVKNGGDISHQVFYRQAVGKSASADFGNKKRTTSTDIAARSAGSRSAISCGVSVNRSNGETG